MKFSHIEQIAKSHFRNAPPTHDWSHTERVLALSLHIGAKEKADLEILRIAALLHDIARLHEKQDHAAEGADLARRILLEEKCSEEVTEAVCHCIATHRFRGEITPKTIEAQVLYDADKLDAIGAVGIARAYLFAGENGQMLYTKKKHSLSRTIDHKNYSPLNEFELKLSKIKGKMLTREGRRIAQERNKYMVRFFERLEKEIEGRQ